MELFEGREVVVFQCLSCNLAVELPASQDGTINYQSIGSSVIKSGGISDVLIAELQKISKKTTLNNDMSLDIAFDSNRERKILSKHLKRNEIAFKILDDSMTIKIPSFELEKLFSLNIFSDEIKHRLTKYFRSPKFIKNYLLRVKDFLKYAFFNEQGRLVFNLPNVKLMQNLQRIFLFSKLYFVNQGNNTIYLPWNSVLFLVACNCLPKHLDEQTTEFMINKWQRSKTFIRNSHFELELLQKEKKIRYFPANNDNIPPYKPKLKKIKKHKISDFI